MPDMLIGSTDRTIQVFIPDPASTDGSGKTGLVAANLTVSYTRTETDNDVVLVDATSSLNNLANLTAAHNDWGIYEVSNTLAPGLYRLDVADAAWASGAWEVTIYVMITTSAAAASPYKFDLVAVNKLDAVRYGLTSLPNAAADAAGGLPISDAGGLDLDAKLANTNEVTAARMGALTDWINGGRLDLILDIIAADTTTDIPALIAALAVFVDTEVAAIKAKTDSLTFTVANQVDANVLRIEGTDATDVLGTAQTGDAFARLGAPAGASVSADIAAIEAQTDDIGAAGAGLTAVPWNAAWDAEVQSEVQDALEAVIADSIPADGDRPSLLQAAYISTQFLLERAVVGTTITIYKPDGTTPLLTLTTDHAVTPTAITRAT